jgi:hypothetical protein
MFFEGTKPLRPALASLSILFTFTLSACDNQEPAFKEERTSRDSGDAKAVTNAGGDSSEMENGLADSESGVKDDSGVGDDSSIGGEDFTGMDGTESGDSGGGDRASTDGPDSGTDLGSSDGTNTGTDSEDGGMESGTEPDINIVRRSVSAIQKGPGKVDILWIVDSSGSMSEEQTYLGNNFNAFINNLVAAGHDFQTAVTSTDICADQIPSNLALRACPVNYGGSSATRHRGSFVGDDGRKVLKHTDSDIVAKFTSYTKVGTNGSGFEHGLKAAEMALEKVTSGTNAPLLRADAFLAVIVVSDEEDDGIGLSLTDPANGRNFTAEGLTTFKYTEDNMIDYLKVVKGEGKFSISSIAPTRNANGSICSAAHSKPVEEGTQYIKAAQKTGGMIQSICETNWSVSLGKLGYDLNAQLTQIVLPSTPDVSTIKVKVNDTVMSAWTFNVGNNAVKFNSNSVPVEGARIQVDYIEEQL